MALRPPQRIQRLAVRHIPIPDAGTLCIIKAGAASICRSKITAKGPSFFFRNANLRHRLSIDNIDLLRAAHAAPGIKRNNIGIPLGSEIPMKLLPIHVRRAVGISANHGLRRKGILAVKYLAILVLNGNLFQASATLEGILPDLGNRIRQRNLPQGRAALQSRLPHLLAAIAKNNLLQLRAATEGILWNLLHGRF